MNLRNLPSFLFCFGFFRRLLCLNYHVNYTCLRGKIIALLLVKG